MCDLNRDTFFIANETSTERRLIPKKIRLMHSTIPTLKSIIIITFIDYVIDDKHVITQIKLNANK